MSDTVELLPQRRRLSKYLFTRFSSALPRSRQRRVANQNPANPKPVPSKPADSGEPPRVLFEQLEPRYLLSADISPFVIAMADAGHDLTLQFDSSSGMLEAINDQTGQTVGEQQASRTSQIQIVGTNENDRLTIDLTAGFALPLGIKFDAGGGQDQLVLGGSADAVMHRIDSNGSGKLSFETGNVGGNLFYNGIEQLTDSVLAQNRSIAVTDAGNNVSLISNADGVTALTTSQGEKLGFGASAKSLSIDAEAANLDNQAYLQADHIALHGLALSIGGTLDARGTIGGLIDLTGGQIDVNTGALIDASGLAGGGSVHVGGGLHGSGALPNAETTVVEHGATINVSAIESGQGGSAVIWADGSTTFSGSILARGGSAGGEGGFVEVSGKVALFFRGDVDASAISGQVGTLLLDPTNVVIANGSGGADDTQISDGQILVTDGGATTFTISEQALEGLSATTNVIIQATNDITLNNLTTDNTLSLQATSGHSVTFTAGGTFSFQSAGDEITTAGGALSITAGTISNLGSFDVGAGALTLDATTSGILLNFIHAGSLNVTAAGNITEKSGSTINVAGTATFSAATFDIDFTGATANQFGTIVIAAAKDVILGDLSNFTGPFTLNVTDSSTVVKVSGSNLALTNTQLTGAAQTVTLSGVGSAELDGDNSGDILNAAGFSGSVTLVGGTGNDTFAGGTGATAYVIGNNFGTDTIIAGLNNNDLLDLTKYTGNLGNLTISADKGTITAGVNTLTQTIDASHAAAARIDVSLTNSPTLQTALSVFLADLVSTISPNSTTSWRSSIATQISPGARPIS
jgi:hypothetical protein